MTLTEQSPATELRVDLATKMVDASGRTFPFSMPDGPRQQFLEGRWDGAAELLSNQEKIRKTAEQIPYFRNFS